MAHKSHKRAGVSTTQRAGVAKSLLITLEYPPNIGGVAAYYREFVQSANENTIVLHLEPSRRRFSWLFFLPRVMRKVQASSSDAILVGQILPLGYTALIIYALLRKPYSVFAHGLDVFQKMSLWKRFWIGVILFFAKEIIANSSFVGKRVQELYRIKSSKLRVAYPKIDVARVEEESSMVLPAIKSARFALLSVGRLVERKGFDKVIEAIRLLHKREQNKNDLPMASPSFIEYWIIGEGRDRARLEQLASAFGVAQSVRFLGEVAVPDIYSYYKACDAFIMPSREIDGDVEGFGIVFLETAVFKKPAIGGQSGGVPEAVVDGVTGLLVDPLSVEEIAEEILRLSLDSELSRTIGEEGYRRVKREFDVN